MASDIGYGILGLGALILVLNVASCFKGEKPPPKPPTAEQFAEAKRQGELATKVNDYTIKVAEQCPLKQIGCIEEVRKEFDLNWNYYNDNRSVYDCAKPYTDLCVYVTARHAASEHLSQKAEHERQEELASIERKHREEAANRHRITREATDQYLRDNPQLYDRMFKFQVQRHFLCSGDVGRSFGRKDCSKKLAETFGLDWDLFRTNPCDSDFGRATPMQCAQAEVLEATKEAVGKEIRKREAQD
ncbi:hypothetical protein [Microvirga sp. BSC39]|uniref:hypothetical protein n=1 Tax=Microvirga sp. BSC39 TaxID=1549810 RepID=UPI0004E9307F|nr:hypothetical protein [Microvirga sp. BSC39]KFG67183.1 hypothetical protein JH26_24175 [Microvirga sp. BSC39]